MFCTKCGARMDETAVFCPACGQPAGPAQATQGQQGPPVSPGVPSMTPVMPAAPEAPAIRTAYAGFWLRFVAWIIDSLIMSAVFMIVLVPLVPVVFRHRPFEQPIPGPGVLLIAFWFWAFNLVGVWLYFALFESSTWQATPGKHVLGLLVTDMQGRRISFARASGRFFGKILSGAILFIGYLMAGFTERKQALHDMLADCLVLRKI